MKKKQFIIFLIFINLNIQAQKYEFDLLTKYKSKMTNYENESLVYSNSKNQNYMLYVYEDSISKNARIYDIEKMNIHNFTVLESKIKTELFFEFKYIGTRTLNRERIYNKYELEANIINTDSINTEIKVEIFKNSKRKKSEMEFVLKGKKIDFNLFPLFRFSCLHPFEFSQKLNLSENILVESAKGLTLSGKKIEYKLLEFREIELEIQIPVNKKPNN